MCVFSKEGMKNEVTFYKKKKGGSKSDLQVAVSGWENKVMGTESVKNVWCHPEMFARIFLEIITGIYVHQSIEC